MPKESKARIKSAHNELLLAVFVLVISLAGLIYASRYQGPTVSIDDSVIKVQIADEPAEQQLGLSGQDPLKSDEGMLFVYKQPDKYGFWMKDMKFSIDIIWIDENLQVVHIEERVSPATYPNAFAPSVDSLYVLEVLAGEAEAQGINLGDRVVLDI